MVVLVLALLWIVVVRCMWVYEREREMSVLWIGKLRIGKCRGRVYCERAGREARGEAEGFARGVGSSQPCGYLSCASC